ncbi:MAG: hypothetical protein LBT60_05210 [Oscillospiraceae bacterium]|jgi:hypothetical protein|nr:hypothetical protein [Oscillospiraceae bacterium]
MVLFSLLTGVTVLCELRLFRRGPQAARVYAVYLLLLGAAVVSAALAFSGRGLADILPVLPPPGGGGAP